MLFFSSVTSLEYNVKKWFFGFISLISLFASFHVFGSENSSNFDRTYLNYCLDSQPHDYFEIAVNILPEIEYTPDTIIQVMGQYKNDEHYAHLCKQELRKIRYGTYLQNSYNSGFGLYKFLFVAGVEFKVRAQDDYSLNSAVKQQYETLANGVHGLSHRLFTSLAHVQKLNLAVNKCEYLYKPLAYTNRVKMADKLRAQKNYFGRF